MLQSTNLAGLGFPLGAQPGPERSRRDPHMLPQKRDSQKAPQPLGRAPAPSPPLPTSLSPTLAPWRAAAGAGHRSRDSGPRLGPVPGLSWLPDLLPRRTSSFSPTCAQEVAIQEQGMRHKRGPSRPPPGPPHHASQTLAPNLGPAGAAGAGAGSISWPLLPSPLYVMNLPGLITTPGAAACPSQPPKPLAVAPNAHCPGLPHHLL